MFWLLVVSVVLIVAGWYWYEGNWDRRLFTSEQGRVCKNILPTEAQAFLDAHSDTQVIDVRSDMEFTAGCLPGAVQISLGDADFERKVSLLDRERPVLVYCAGGFRSRKAAAILKAQGFTNIQHLHRGFHSWQFSGLPTQ